MNAINRFAGFFAVVVAIVAVLFSPSAARADMILPNKAIVTMSWIPRGSSELQELKNKGNLIVMIGPSTTIKAVVGTYAREYALATRTPQLPNGAELNQWAIFDNNDGVRPFPFHMRCIAGGVITKIIERNPVSQRAFKQDCLNKKGAPEVLLIAGTSGAFAIPMGEVTPIDLAVNLWKTADVATFTSRYRIVFGKDISIVVHGSQDPVSSPNDNVTFRVDGKPVTLSPAELEAAIKAAGRVPDLEKQVLTATSDANFWFRFVFVSAVFFLLLGTFLAKSVIRPRVIRSPVSQASSNAPIREPEFCEDPDAIGFEKVLPSVVKRLYKLTDNPQGFRDFFQALDKNRPEGTRLLITDQSGPNAHTILEPGLLDAAERLVAGLQTGASVRPEDIGQFDNTRLRPLAGAMWDLARRGETLASRAAASVRRIIAGEQLDSNDLAPFGNTSLHSLLVSVENAVKVFSHQVTEFTAFLLRVSDGQMPDIRGFEKTPFRTAAQTALSLGAVHTSTKIAAAASGRSSALRAPRSPTFRPLEETTSRFLCSPSSAPEYCGTGFDDSLVSSVHDSAPASGTGFPSKVPIPLFLAAVGSLPHVSSQTKGDQNGKNGHAQTNGHTGILTTDSRRRFKETLKPLSGVPVAPHHHKSQGSAFRGGNASLRRSTNGQRR